MPAAPAKGGCLFSLMIWTQARGRTGDSVPTQPQRVFKCFTGARGPNLLGHFKVSVAGVIRGLAGRVSYWLRDL